MNTPKRLVGLGRMHSPDQTHARMIVLRRTDSSLARTYARQPTIQMTHVHRVQTATRAEREAKAAG
jgi:hypothetical protein